MTKLAIAKAWLLKRPFAVVICAITIGVVLFAVKRTLDQSWTPVSDNAGIWMRTWDVGTRHTPLVGPPSRFGWHHPGPLLFYLLAPLLRLFGGLPSAVLAGVFLIGLASTIGIVVLAARTAETGAALVLALGTALLCFCYGDRLTDPWNPHVVVLPFALFLVAAWFASCGDAIAAPIAVVAGTFAAQSHLGALPPVVIIGVTAAALGLFFPPRLARTGSRRFWALTFALPFLLWAPPLVEQLSASGGNIARLFRFFRDPASGPPLGFSNGLRVAGYELLPWGPWLGRERPTLFGQLPIGEWWELPLSCSPLVIALLLALRFRDALGVRLVAIGAAAVAACVVANAQTRGAPLGYLTLWSRSIAMLIVTAPFVVLARKYAPSSAPWLRSGVARLAPVAIVSLTMGTRVIGADVPLPQFSSLYERIVRSATEVFPAGTTVRVVPVGPPLTASSEAIVVGLERAGRGGKMLERYAFEVGEHRTVLDQASVPTLMILFASAVEQRPKPEIGWLVDRYDPLNVQERKEATMLREKIEVGLRAAGKEDLVQPLRDGAAWIWLSMPATVDSTELGRYFALASGVEKLPWALYALPPAAW